MSLKRLNFVKNTRYLFFRNPPLLQISTFSLGQKGCAYYEKSAYYECAYYERAQYNPYKDSKSIKSNNFIHYTRRG